MLELGTAAAAWTQPHLLSLESLSAEEINMILDTAETFKDATRRMAGTRFRRWPARRSRICFSRLPPAPAPASPWPPGGWGPTRSISRLGQQSVERGDVYRHGQEYRGHGGRRGGGAASHARHAATLGTESELLGHQRGRWPARASTQGLLDILTIRDHRGDLAGLTVALVGDIATAALPGRISGACKSSGPTSFCAGHARWFRGGGKN